MSRFLAFTVAAALSLSSIGCGEQAKSRAEDTKAGDSKPGDVKAEGSKPADVEKAERKVAPEAMKVLADWYGSLTVAKTLQCDMLAAFSIKQNGADVKGDVEEFSFAAERPNKLALRGKKPTMPTFVSDGVKALNFDAEKNIYTLDPALPTFADYEKSLVLSSYNQNQGLSIVGDALAGLPLEKIAGNYSSIEYIGKEDVGGKPMHHLRVAQDGVHLDWWFAADAKTELLAIAPNVNEIAAKNGKQISPGFELNVKVSFTNWAYDAALPADAFKITPPADASLVEDLSAPLGLTLVGKPAPLFEGKNLKGETVKLADLKGKIVVLDFWATWCPPCVAGLPKLTEMTAKFKDDGVVFIAVNLQEEASIVKEFLDLKKLDINCVLDTDNAIMMKYKVEPVPQTVFIGRDGVVQVVHIGIGELEQIPTQLKDLVAGKDLAAEAKKKALEAAK